MQRKFIYIGAAFFLAIMAMYLINIYLKEEAKGARDRAKRDVMKMQEMQATVVVAKNDIPKGTTLNQDMLETKTILKDYLQPKAVLAPERV
ncbi:MAG: SAF domain-containing protein, partial [Deltaproteobacteria bacterium]